MRSMRHLKSLGYFVAVAQNKSIREAAETQHLTSSALNRHILDLEEELGAPLFERHARGVRLSAAGETYLAYARKALRDAEEVHSRIDDLQGLKRGHIALATIAAAADPRMMQVITDFQRRYPKVGFSLTVMGSEQIVKAVTSHDADLGITFNPPPIREFAELASCEYSVHAVMTRDHPLADRPVVSLLEMTAYPLALADRSWGGRRLLDEVLSKTGLKLEPQLVSNSFDVLIDFARARQGVSFQVYPGYRRQPLRHDLMVVPVRELRRYARRMVLGSLRDRVLPVASALFSETLKRDVFAAEPT